MAITHVYSDANRFSTTKVVPLATHTASDRAAILFISSEGPSHTSTTLNSYTGWTLFLDLSAGSGYKPRMWGLYRQLTGSDSDYTIDHSGTGGWSCVIFEGDLDLASYETQSKYAYTNAWTDCTVSAPGTGDGVRVGCFATNSSTSTTEPSTAIASDGNGYSNCDGSYQIDTSFTTGTSPAFQAGGGTDYTLGWVFIPQDTTQTIEPTAIASGSSLGTPTVSSTYNIEPTAIASGSSFGSPTVSPGAVDISPTAIASGASIPTPSVDPGAVNISPTAIASGATLGSPTVSPGAVNISPSAITSGESIPTPTVSPGAVNISPTAITSGESVPTPTVSSTYEITPTAIASGASIPTPTVENAASTQNISPTAIASGASIPTPTVSSTYEITPTAITSGESIPTPTVSPGTANISPSAITSGESIPTPTVSPGAVNIGPTAISSGESIPTPTVSPGAVSITPTAITSGESIPTPTVSPGAVNISPTAIASTVSIPTPSVWTGDPITEMMARPLSDRTEVALLGRLSMRSERRRHEVKRAARLSISPRSSTKDIS